MVKKLEKFSNKYYFTEIKDNIPEGMVLVSGIEGVVIEDDDKDIRENIKIFQGDQIGGCVTVISSTVNGETHRIMIDYGSSLEGSATVKDFDYPWEEEPIDAVFFTHYHGDHVGRISEIPGSVKKLYMGETARKVMINIQQIPNLLWKYLNEVRMGMLDIKE